MAAILPKPIRRSAARLVDSGQPLHAPPVATTLSYFQPTCRHSTIEPKRSSRVLEPNAFDHGLQICAGQARGVLIKKI